NLHIGVATSDLGTSAVGDAMPGPALPGTGGCMGTGKDGELQTSSMIGPGNFILDVGNSDGSRSVNYTGTLASTFSAVASVGTAGCGFEQTLEAVQRALANTTANAGFLRPNANLAVVILSDEDDCSLEHASLIGNDTTTFGP